MGVSFTHGHSFCLSTLVILLYSLSDTCADTHRAIIPVSKNSRNSSMEGWGERLAENSQQLSPNHNVHDAGWREKPVRTISNRHKIVV